jgi:AraC family transcriptional regulator
MFGDQTHPGECSNAANTCLNVHSIEGSAVNRPAVADYPAGAGLPPRVIEDFEFVWMLRGTARFEVAEVTPLAPGDLLLVPPGIRHRFEWDAAQPSRHGYVHFGPADVGRLPVPMVRLIRMSDADPLAGLCAYLLWIGGGNHDEWQIWQRRTLEFMLALVDSGPLPSLDAAPTPSGPVLAAISHLRREWARMPLRRIGVQELARAAHVSRGYLNRLFQAGFGVSASVALEHLRCSRAEALLTRTDLKVAAIAHQCGYADVEHFSHRFSFVHSVSPTGYRAAADQAPSVLEQPGVLRLNRLVWA